MPKEALGPERDRELANEAHLSHNTNLHLYGTYLQTEGRMVKTIHIRVSDEEHSDMEDRKGDRTWREVLEDGLE